jgi:FKBP-type peptidyl-prolyl cis-trans isomerase 2
VNLQIADSGIFAEILKNMQQAKKGDTVRVHYTGKLVSGEQFDSSAGREPLEFEVGAGMMIKGFDDAVVGMTIGDKKTINILPLDGYGERSEEMVIDFPRSNFPDDMTPEAGMQLMMNNSAGQQFPVTIMEVKEDVVILDANHMLAGKELVFDIEMVEIDSKGLIIMP